MRVRGSPSNGGVIHHDLGHGYTVKPDVENTTDKKIRVVDRGKSMFLIKRFKINKNNTKRNVPIKIRKCKRLVGRGDIF